MTKPGTQPAEGGIEALIGSEGTRSPWPRRLLWSGLLLAAAAGLAWYFLGGGTARKGPSFVTEAARVGTLSVSVTANGTLQPTRSVNIGSELSGTVARVLVDVNDRVVRGQVLAELDTARLTDQTRRSRASVASAEARIAAAEATATEARGNLARMEEVSRLSGGKVPSRAELDTARAALERALADTNAARATLADAKAALSADETNLRKASIRSPIDGLVLTRSVDPGNAVAASLQAVTLFTVAEDLTRMVLKVNVDEADVGQVRDGQSATFTVSAWPDRRYPATITRVGYGATTKDNVVTYVTELEVGNQDLSLRPGMTATATITATERRDVLLVPNAALRFTPLLEGAAAPSGSGASGSGASAGSASGGAPGTASGAGNGSAANGAKAGGASGGGIVSRLMPRPPIGGGRRAGGASGGGARQVWVLRDGAPVAVAITPGLSDGRFTEVRGGDLKAGDPVIVEQSVATP